MLNVGLVCEMLTIFHLKFCKLEGLSKYIGGGGWFNPYASTTLQNKLFWNFKCFDTTPDVLYTFYFFLFEFYTRLEIIIDCIRSSCKLSDIRLLQYIEAAGDVNSPEVFKTISLF